MPKALKFDFQVGGLSLVNRALGLMATSIRDLRPVWDEIHRDFMSHERDLFEAQGAVGGLSKWKELNRNYRAWKMSRGYDGRILIKTGRLRESLVATGKDHVFRTSSKRMTVGTRVPYAIYHQEGRGVPLRAPIRATEDMRRRWTRMIQRYVIASGQFQRLNIL